MLLPNHARVPEAEQMVGRAESEAPPQADRGRWAAVAALIAAVSAAPPLPPAEAAPPASAPSMSLADVAPPAKRFGEFADRLPDSARLGVRRILAQEENRLFVHVAGADDKKLPPGRPLPSGIVPHARKGDAPGKPKE